MITSSLSDTDRNDSTAGTLLLEKRAGSVLETFRGNLLLVGQDGQEPEIRTDAEPHHHHASSRVRKYTSLTLLTHLVYKKSSGGRSQSKAK